MDLEDLRFLFERTFRPGETTLPDTFREHPQPIDVLVGVYQHLPPQLRPHVPTKYGPIYLADEEVLRYVLESHGQLASERLPEEGMAFLRGEQNNVVSKALEVLIEAQAPVEAQLCRDHQAYLAANGNPEHVPDELRGRLDALLYHRPRLYIMRKGFTRELRVVDVDYGEVITIHDILVDPLKACRPGLSGSFYVTPERVTPQKRFSLVDDQGQRSVFVHPLGFLQPYGNGSYELCYVMTSKPLNR